MASLPALARVLVERVASFQVQTVRLRLHDRGRSSGFTKIVDPPGDVGRDRALEIENLADVAFVGLGPQVHVGGHLDQLRRDPHAVAARR